MKVWKNLQRCSLVGIPQWTPDAEEFSGILTAVREIIRGTDLKSG